MSNLYDVLGVPRSADDDAIRKAYKDLARRYHPDRNDAPDAEERFKEINAAYDVLGDKEKRRLFDQFGEASLRPGFDPARARAWGAGGGRGGGRPEGFPGGFDFHGGAGAAGFEDVLESLFGSAAGRGPRARRGRDQHAELTIEPLLAITGGETTLGVPRPDGSAEALRVRIPPGVRDGGRLTLRGQGYPTPGGGPCGDLHIKLHVPEHGLLRRVGDDLELDLPLTVLEAVRGAEITVPTPTGKVKVRIPPGSSSGTRLRLKGRGVQTASPGDLYLVLRPTVPDRIDDGVLAAAEALEHAYGPIRDGLVL